MPEDIQTLSCVCGTLSDLFTKLPTGTLDTLQSLCAAYPGGSCTTTSTSDQGISLPISGLSPTSALGNLRDLGNVASVLGNLPIAKEKRDLEDRQLTSTTTGGGLDLSGTNVPGLVLGATGLGSAGNVVSGLTNAAPQLLGTAGQVANVAGLGGILARGEEKEKRQAGGLTTIVSGIAGGLVPGGAGGNPVTSTVTGLVGSLTGGLGGGSNPLSGVTGGLTGGSSPLSGVTGILA